MQINVQFLKRYISLFFRNQSLFTIPTKLHWITKCMHTYAKRSLKFTGELTVVVVILRVNNNNNIAHQCIDIKYPSMSPKGDFQTSFESSPHFLETLKLSNVFRIPFSVAFPHLSIVYSILTFTTCIWMYSHWTHANNAIITHFIPSRVCVCPVQAQLRSAARWPGFWGALGGRRWEYRHSAGCKTW